MTSIKKSEILNSIEFCNENNYFTKLNDIYSTLPKGDCSGCGNCCMESVGINLIEFLNIYNFLKDKEELSRESMEKIIDYYFLELLENKPCPFRDENNRCKIYEVRPLNCRLFGHWREQDYNNNLKRVINRNLEYQEEMKKTYGINVSKEVLDFSIKYCKKFKPEIDYLSKKQRLDFSDRIMMLDSRVLGSGLIDISYRDRGIVEYFIEHLINQDFAYKTKIRLTKENNLKVVDRIKKILIK